MSEPSERTSYEAYIQQRKELAEAVPAAVRVTKGDDRNLEYRKEQTLTYLLNLNGELIRRIEELEQRLAERDAPSDDDDVPTGGGVEGPFDPNDRTWEH